MPEPTTPPPLPDVLLREAVSVKLLWAYLRPCGVVAYSSYKLAEALGLSQPATTLGLARLRELGLVKDLGERRARVRAVYKAVDSVEATLAVRLREDVPRGPQPLPEALKLETPTTRLVYVYLAPHGEVTVSVRQLEALLGSSHRPSAEAMQRLVALRLLRVLDQGVNRPGRFRVEPYVV